MGLSKGDRKEVFISKTSLPGQLDDDFHFNVIVDAVREATKEEIQKGYAAEDVQTESCGAGCNC